MVDKIELYIIRKLNLMTHPRRNYAIIIIHLVLMLISVKLLAYGIKLF